MTTQKLKISSVTTLSGAALDWAVAKLEEQTPDKRLSQLQETPYSPSTNWSQGGPIIERERFFLRYWTNSWRAETYFYIMYGPTPLIAAMRCYVASKLGIEVEIPEELIELHLSS